MKILDYYFLLLDAPGDFKSTNESLIHTLYEIWLNNTRGTTIVEFSNLPITN